MTGTTRVALVGLSTDQGTWAINSHFPALKQSPHYQITALVNSSVASAQKAIKHYELDPSTKAYGRVEDAANDPDVDLVVISVFVGKHHELALPAIKGGKDVVVEWPLGANLAEAKELTALAKEKNVKTAVGLQWRNDPAIAKIKEVIDSGKIGTVLSSTAVTAFGSLFSKTVPARYRFLPDVNSGGNLLSIPVAHFVDSIFHVLGELKSYNSYLKTDFPTVSIVDDTGKVVEENVPKTSHDQITLQGLFESGAIFSLHARSGDTIDGVNLRWSIYGTDGLIELTSTVPIIAYSPTVTIKVRGSGKDAAVEEIQVQRPEHLPIAAGTFANLYEAFWKGDKENYVDFDHAVKRHEFIEGLLKNSGK